MKKPTRILFVCARALQRSPTAVDVAVHLAKQAGRKVKGIDSDIDFDYEILSAGTCVDEENEEGRQVDKDLCDRMNIIVAMDYSIQQHVINYCRQAPGRVANLEIEDKYERGDKELIEILEKELARYLQ